MHSFAQPNFFTGFSLVTSKQMNMQPTQQHQTQEPVAMQLTKTKQSLDVQCRLMSTYCQQQDFTL